MLDGSSIAGWKAITESDMVLLPDPTTAHRDAFLDEPTLVLICDVLDPVSGALKTQAVVRLETTPHPVEFDLYYSV